MKLTNSKKSLFILYKKINDTQEEKHYFLSRNPLTHLEKEKLSFLVVGNDEKYDVREKSFLSGNNLMEVGPHMYFEAPFASYAKGIFDKIGLTKIVRTVKTNCYAQDAKHTHIVSDRVLDCIYHASPDLEAFEKIKPKKVFRYDLLERTKENAINLLRTLGVKDDVLATFWYNYFVSEERNPTNLEIFKMTKGKTEHSEHPYFSGVFIENGVRMEESCFEIVKSPLKKLGDKGKEYHVIAFDDDASAIRGRTYNFLGPSDSTTSSSYTMRKSLWHITFKVETHNFPCTYEAYHGAMTGVGGLDRDLKVVKRGGISRMHGVGVSVSGLNISNYHIAGERRGLYHPPNLETGLNIYIKGTNGGCTYNNEIGVPVTIGCLNSIDMEVDGVRRAYMKPICIVFGTGVTNGTYFGQAKLEPGMKIIAIGGPAMRIGMGGGDSASRPQSDNAEDEDVDRNAVQRGNALEGNKIGKVMRAFVLLYELNIIIIGIDQGAAGPCNSAGEIAQLLGGQIDISKIKVADQTMTREEIFGCEFQERIYLVVKEKDVELAKKVADRENCNLEILGEITDDMKFTVIDGDENDEKILELPVQFKDFPRKQIIADTYEKKLFPFEIPDVSIREALRMVMQNPEVGSKKWVVHKGDMSVGGLVVQPQICGPMQLTIANAAIARMGFDTDYGQVCAIGSNPRSMMIDPVKGARIAIAEAYTKLCISCELENLDDIALYFNWMWATGYPGQDYALRQAVITASDFGYELGLASNGGKDSLSMAVETKEGPVLSPDTLEVSAYAGISDVKKRYTPDIKKPGDSKLLVIDLSKGDNELGGSTFAQAFGALGDNCPDTDPKLLRRGMEAVQDMMRKNLILSTHKTVSDGLYVALAEMIMANRSGLDIVLPGDRHALSYFSMNNCVIIEYEKKNEDAISEILSHAKLDWRILGKTRREARLKIIKNDNEFETISTITLHQAYERTSYELSKIQANPVCAQEEFDGINNMKFRPYHYSFDTGVQPQLPAKKHRAAILRDIGTNGEVEMANYFMEGGFDAVDVSMQDLLDGTANVLDFPVVVLCGGFSNADVYGAGVSWAAKILFNPILADQFEKFSGLVLGVCNGFQTIALLELLGKGIRLRKNESEKFESRLSRVTVPMHDDSPFTRGMGGSELPIWCAHGEGRIHLPPDLDWTQVQKQQGVLYYADDDGVPTTKYPDCPNNSYAGLAGLMSTNKKVFGSMPHPERTPEVWKKIVQNMYEWVDSHL